MGRVADGGDEVELELDDDDDGDGGRRAGAAAPAAVPALGRRALRRRRLVAAAGVVVLLAAVAVGVRVQRGADAAGDGPAPLDGTASAQELFPVLAQPARPGTGLPDDGLAQDVGVEPGSERLLAVAPAASYWVAQTPTGGVCLLVRSTDDRLARNGICTSPARAVGGLALPAGGGPSGTLLPRGASTAEVEAAGDAELVPGLWVDSATASGVVVAAVEGASDRLPAVPVTVRRGTGWLPVLLTTQGRPYAVVLSCLSTAPVRLSLDAEEVPSRTCPADGLVRPFVGTGEPVQVGLQAPTGLLWAAEVVTCTGPASAPTC
ncbi:hypothetical protein [Quadrisphaera sp. KR29]|uniref:hypothetical protein n=1 Tax=Quadrisphaera sp. KR29 TaxID=3461391 RepID=UPI004044D032